MMVDRKHMLALALAAAAMLWTTGAWGDPPAHLVPFPEDAAQEAARPKPVKPEPPKSTFQPRFRPPNVKRAEPLEAAGGEETAATSAEPATEEAMMQDGQVAPASAAEPIVEKLGELLPADESAEPLPSGEQGPELIAGSTEPVATGEFEGREALNEAYTLSKKATAEEEYTRIIALCKSGKIGVSQAYQQYADQLMGWAYNRRGEARAKDGRDKQALSDFETAVRLGGAWRAIHNRGVSYAAAGRMEEAAADFDRTIELNPRYTNAYYNRAELRYRNEDYMGAVEDYSRAIKLGPRDAAMFNGRGHAFYRLEHFGDALRDYGEAIKLDPGNPDPLINRGDTYSDLGQYGEAAADYRAAVKVAPQNGRAFQAAAWLMATCPDSHYRDETLAVDAALRAIELDGETFRNLSTLAAAQASAGQFDEAQKTQERAIASASKEQVLNGERMMALYQREIAFRDRPLTAYETPEEMEVEMAEQATYEAHDPVLDRPQRASYQEPVQRQPSGGAQATQQQRRVQQIPPIRQGRYNEPVEYPSGWQQILPKSLFGGSDSSRGQQPPPEQDQRAPRARLFGPKGRI